MATTSNSSLNESRGLSSIHNTEPILDMDELKRLGEGRVEFFYEKLDKTLNILHSNGNGKGPERG